MTPRCVGSLGRSLGRGMSPSRQTDSGTQIAVTPRKDGEKNNERERKHGI